MVWLATAAMGDQKSGWQAAAVGLVRLYPAEYRTFKKEKV